MNLCCVQSVDIDLLSISAYLFSELVHCGRKLKDDLTLDACGILSGSTIHILKKTWPEPESSPGVCMCLSFGQHFNFTQFYNLNRWMFPSVRACEQSYCSQGVQGVSRCSSLPQLYLQRLGEWNAQKYLLEMKKKTSQDTLAFFFLLVWHSW